MRAHTHSNAGALNLYRHEKTKGVPAPKEILDALRKRIAARGTTVQKGFDHAAAWWSLDADTRAVLVSFCTSKGIEQADRVRWGDMTPAEHEAIGAFMRQMKRAAVKGAGLW